MTISMANCLFIDKIGFIPPLIFIIFGGRKPIQLTLT